MRIVVVLPAPLGPRKPNSSPRSTWRSRWSTAKRFPYALERARARSAGWALVIPD